MAENALANILGGNVQKYDADAFKDVSKSGDYLPRVQLFGSSSGPVKEGKIPMAHYGLVNTKEDITDMGDAFDCIVAAWRPKALRIGADSTVSNYFDPSNPEFAKIKLESADKDSGCMYGPEYLVWLPAYQQWATFFFSNPTMRRESPNMQKLIGRAATAKVRLIKTSQYTWHGPSITECSVKLEPLPTPEDAKKQLETFVNQESSKVEVADAEQAQKQKRAR